MMPIPEGYELVEDNPVPEGYELVEELAQTAEAKPDSLGKDVLDVVGEFAASVNRGVTEFIDFVGPNTVNAILQASGSDARVPTLTESLAPATQGGFMEPGTAREIVRSAGSVVPAAAGLKTVSGRDVTKLGGATAEFLGFGAAKNPAAIAGQQLVNEGKEQGIPVLTSDALPPKTFANKAIRETAEKVPYAGTGPVRQAQQELREQAVDRVANQHGEFSYDAIVQSLKDQKNKVKNAAGNVLERVGSELDGRGPIETKSTKTAIAQVRDELSRPGVIQSDKAINDLQALIDVIDQPQTFTTLRENRTAFREIVDSVDPSGRSQLTSRAKALLKGVEKAITKDMESFSQKNLDGNSLRQWKRANAVYASEANKLTRTKLKNVLDKGDMTPEAVNTMLFSRNSSDQQLLYKSLTSTGRENARAAIISKVIEDSSKLKGGVTPNSFVNKLKKYDSQIEVFFKGREKKQLEGLMRVLDATQRAQDASVTTPTGQGLIGLAGIGGLLIDSGSTLGAAGTVGGLARLYESAPVRNALLRLGSLPRSSNGYDEALQAAAYTLYGAVTVANAGQAEEEGPQQQ